MAKGPMVDGGGSSKKKTSAAAARKLVQADKAGTAKSVAAANIAAAMKGPVGYKAPAKNLFSPKGPKNRPTDRPSYGQPASSAPKNRPTDRPSYGPTRSAAPGAPAAGARGQSSSSAPQNRPTDRPTYGNTGSQSATPPTSTATRGYVVKKGDTMWDIASRYKPSGATTNAFLDKMIAANKMTRKSAGKIDIGQKIIIPKGK